MLQTVDARPIVVGRAAPAVLASTAIGLQISYPLLSGSARSRVTVATVVVFAAAVVASALVTRRRSAVAALAAVAAIGLAAELVGSHTGVPFGRYRYADTLGLRLAGVPLVIALGWLMMAWPAALAARRLVTGRLARVVVGAWALAAWDLFLDPQMVDAGHWAWAHPDPHLPGVATVPLTNLAGWLAVSIPVSVLLQRVLDHHPARVPGDGWMHGLYLWTYASSVLAVGVFLGLPWAAGWGAVGMGVVAVPLARRLSAR